MLRGLTDPCVLLIGKGAQIEMDLILYPRLKPHSKTALKRKRKRWGHAYEYRPRRTLVARLSYETGLTPTQVREQLFKERDHVMQYPQYY